VPAPRALPVPGLCRSTDAESPLLQCVLTGTWTNDLGSNMTIEAVNGLGNFAGTYHTAVTATMNKIQRSLLQGSQHHVNQKSQPTFGFTVNWSFSGSTTTSIGQCLIDQDRKEILRTTWIMQDEVASLEDDWKASK
ncbi:AVID protein, partial [Chunga burmeisteri]|nr:AVID protein [Chunga burmeisteri]